MNPQLHTNFPSPFFFFSCKPLEEKNMGCGKVVFILFTISALLPPTAVLGDLLSPLLSPVFNGICNVVECGKGNCEASMNHTFGFICKCNSGWRQFQMGDYFKFLPCIIPNCSISYSCTNDSVAQAPAPAPAPPNNLSLFDPCMWAYCGGGECSSTSTYEHKCKCNDGYSNLFNLTTFPCYKDCSIGADCKELGINFPGSTSSAASPPNLSATGSSSGADPFAGKNMIWSCVSIILFTMVLKI